MAETFQPQTPSPTYSNISYRGRQTLSHTTGGTHASMQDDGSESDDNIDPALKTPPQPVAQDRPVGAQLLIDILSQRFQLPASQKKDLEGLHQMASKNPALGMVFLQGHLYGMEKRLMDQLNVGVAAPTDQSGVLKELSNRLEDSWTLTSEQKKNIKRFCLEQMYKPGRTKFKGIHMDFYNRIKLHKEEYHLGNVFGRAQREKELLRCIRACSSNVRNMLRQELVHSLEERWSVQKLATDLVSQNNLTESTTTQAMLVHVVLLRRFCRDHQPLLLEEPETLSDDSDANEEGERPAKKQKRGRGQGRGRLRDGEDFWGQVDTWFTEKKEGQGWGEEFSKGQWKRFIDESLIWENEFSSTSKAKKSKKAAKSASVAVVPSQGQTSSGSSASLPSGEGGLLDWERLQALV